MKKEEIYSLYKCAVVWNAKVNKDVFTLWVIQGNTNLYFKMKESPSLFIMKEHMFDACD